MDWQQILSLIVVAASAVLLVRNEMRKRHRANQRICGRDCGCSSSEALEKFKKEHKEVLS